MIDIARAVYRFVAFFKNLAFSSSLLISATSLRFDGAIFRHWTEKFRGERYAIIFYCHGKPRVQPEPQPGASMYVAILSAENDAAIADTLRIVEDAGLLHLATVFAAQDEMKLYQEAIDQAGLSVQLACAPPGPKEQRRFILDHFYPPDSRVVVLTDDMTERDIRDALMPATEPRFFLYNMIYRYGLCA
jgi:hypothetical protein